MKRAKVASSTYSAGSTSSTTWKYDLQPCPKKNACTYRTYVENARVSQR
jgi:hypothetical protein